MPNELAAEGLDDNIFYMISHGKKRQCA